MELPDRAHGTSEIQGEETEFLRFGEEDYIAEPGYGFEPGYVSESGAVYLELLKPLLAPGVEEPFTDLERQSDQTLAEREMYHITFRLDMRGFVETLTEEQLTGIAINGSGELFIDQQTLLPHRFVVDCESCFLPVGSDIDLLADFILSEFNEPVTIPSPDDVPMPLPTPTRRPTATPAPFATTEYQNILAATQAMMTDNNLPTLVNPVSANTAPCTTGTQDMTAFPDSSTVAATKVTYLGGTAGAADLPGFILFGHDITMDNAATSLVNYTSRSTATFCYTVTADGTITQYTEAGQQLNPAPAPAATPAPAPFTTTEYQNIITATRSMMVDNNLPTLVNPVSANTAPCTTGTQDMTAFPDSNTVAATKVTYLGGTAGAADLPGFILFGHDITMNNAATSLVNYTSRSTATYCYTVTADGTITQYTEAGQQLNPTLLPTPTRAPTATPDPSQPTATPVPLPDNIQLLAKWGSEGAGGGQFNDPIGIAVDGLGNVYVADNGNNRVQVFTAGGEFLRT